MTLDVRFHPLGTWPGERTKSPKRGTFKVSWGKILNDLERELNYLKAHSIMIFAGFQAFQIRADGWPKGGSAPIDQGIVLQFESKHGTLKYACDTYDHWHQNLRAISLTLDNLRAVDRYGATKTGEQYKGWKSLPEQPGAALTVDAALEWLSSVSKIYAPAMRTSEDAFNQACRKAATVTHPDAGGSNEQFQKFQQIKDFLKRSLFA